MFESYGTFQAEVDYRREQVYRQWGASRRRRTRGRRRQAGESRR